MSTIPKSTMQTMKLPAPSVCDRFDRLNMNSLWGDTTDQRKIKIKNHLCKGRGCLGIKTARKKNLALLAKLGWKVIRQDDSLWANILRYKYLRYSCPSLLA